MLGLLVGCGLRRGELAGLEFSDVAQREGRWAIVDLVGKHGRVRTVPMPSWAKTALDAWASAAGISTGAVLRRVDKGGRVGPGPITPQGVFEAVVRYARKAGLGKITPHDLRRTFAKLAHLGRAPLEQSRPRSATWGSSRICTMRRVIGWDSSAGRGEGGAGNPGGVVGAASVYWNVTSYLRLGTLSSGMSHPSEAGELPQGPTHPLKVHRLKAMGSGDTNTLSRLKPTFAAAQTAAFRRRSFGGSGPFGTS